MSRDRAPPTPWGIEIDPKGLHGWFVTWPAWCLASAVPGPQKEPVSGATGLWYFPGMFILVGPIIWFVKTNGALNDYWKSLGAQG
ncbi:hypothetical protein GCM10027270_31590 [Nocardioides ginkgobilobae]